MGRGQVRRQVEGAPEIVDSGRDIPFLLPDGGEEDVSLRVQPVPRQGGLAQHPCLGQAAAVGQLAGPTEGLRSAVRAGSWGRAPRSPPVPPLRAPAPAAEAGRPRVSVHSALHRAGHGGVQLRTAGPPVEGGVRPGDGHHGPEQLGRSLRRADRQPTSGHERPPQAEDGRHAARPPVQYMRTLRHRIRSIAAVPPSRSGYVSVARLRGAKLTQRRMRGSSSKRPSPSGRKYAARRSSGVWRSDHSR